MGILETLGERGFIQQISDEAGLRDELERGPITLYWGTDPTADSLTAGHLVSLMMLAHFQRAGHKPIVVVGGGTGLIGDPLFRTETRQLMTIEQIERHMAGQRPQIGRFVDFSDEKGLLLNNADWLAPLGYLEFLRDIGRSFTVNQLLQHSTYRERLETGSLNFIEINYALLQAYDFLYLHREHRATLQVGGADQWFNILAGTELIRREVGHEAYALITPLLTTATGEKMGKSAGNAVWLDAARTSPYDFYQYWINTADVDVERFLGYFTFLPMDEVHALGHREGADLREAKERLALEVTSLVHGPHAAADARDASRALFSGSGDGDAAPTTEIEPARLAGGIDLLDLLVETGLSPSRRAARDLVHQGGAYVNGVRVDDVAASISEQDLQGEGVILLRAGKKRFHRVVVKA